MRGRAELALPDFLAEYSKLRDEYPLDVESSILARLSAKTGVALRELERLSDSQGWEQEYREGKLVASARAIQLAQATSGARHLKLSHMMQEAALNALEKLFDPEEKTFVIRTPEEARRLIKTAVEVERLVLGEPTQYVQMDHRDRDERIKWLLEKMETYKVLDIAEDEYSVEDQLSEDV